MQLFLKCVTQLQFGYFLIFSGIAEIPSCHEIQSYSLVKCSILQYKGSTVNCMTLIHTAEKVCWITWYIILHCEISRLVFVILFFRSTTFVRHKKLKSADNSTSQHMTASSKLSLTMDGCFL